jgi:hypothetical protein
MPDVGLVREILRQILCSVKTIVRRFEPIHSASDFTSSDEGMDRCMNGTSYPGRVASAC